MTKPRVKFRYAAECDCGRLVQTTLVRTQATKESSVHVRCADCRSIVDAPEVGSRALTYEEVAGLEADGGDDDR